MQCMPRLPWMPRLPKMPRMSRWSPWHHLRLQLQPRWEAEWHRVETRMKCAIQVVPSELYSVLNSDRDFVDQTVFIFGLDRFVMFFNLMNLDTKLVVAILGKISLCVVDTFGFPTLLFFDPPWLNLEVRLFAVQDSLTYFTMLSPCTNMKRTASQAFEDPAPPILKPVLELTLHIALSHYLLFNSRRSGSASYTPWSVLIWLRIENGSNQGSGKGPLFHELERSLCFAAHHRWRLKSLCFARFTSRPWVSFLCNKQGFLNQEMDATRIARGISVIKDPCFTHTHRRASQSSDGIFRFATECQELIWVPPSPFVFSGIAGG